MNHPAPVDAAQISGISVRRLIDLRANTTPDAAFLTGILLAGDPVKFNLV